jgi:hypothetical protein
MSGDEAQFNSPTIVPAQTIVIKKLRNSINLSDHISLLLPSKYAFCTVLKPPLTFPRLVFNYRRMLYTILLRRHKTIRSIPSVLAPNSNTHIKRPVLTTVSRYKFPIKLLSFFLQNLELIFKRNKQERRAVERYNVHRHIG